MDNKSITIVAPAYNHEKYITKCLNSIANQNIEFMELIVIDDVSRDNTRRIIEDILKNKGFVSKFKNGVSFIKHDKNMGAFYSLNEGLKCAKGEYLTMINTDDYYGDNHLSLLMEACERNGSEFAFGGVNIVDQNDNSVDSGYGKGIMKYQSLIEKCPTVSMALSRGNSTISTGNMLFTRRLYDELQGFANYKYVHDWDFALRAALITEPVYVKEAQYIYRLHTGNTIAEINQKNRNPDALEKPINGQTIGINPLVMYFINIIKGKYTNNKIPGIDVWEYFIYRKRYYDGDDSVIWAWNRAKYLVEDMQF